MTFYYLKEIYEGLHIGFKKMNKATVGIMWFPYLTAGMACLFIRQGPGGKVKGGSPCNGMSESDIAKGGVASNYQIQIYPFY